MIVISCLDNSFRNFPDEDKAENISLLLDSNFVTLNQALEIAELQNGNHTRSMKTIKKIAEIKDNLGIPQYYVINYENEGFIIISAEKRINPILAYSYTNSFDLAEDRIPQGVISWMEFYRCLVDSVRNYDIRQDLIIKHDWSLVQTRSLKSIESTSPTTKSSSYGSYIYVIGDPSLDHDDCGIDGQILTQSYYFAPPLLSTTWDQSNGYNERTPYLNCFNTGNGRAFAGCVTIAVGQVMLHHRYPNNYNWDAIYNFGNGYGAETNEFIRSLAQELNSSYSCYATLSTIESALHVLKSKGYVTSNISSVVRPGTIVFNLKQRRPVIFSGRDRGSSIGHMWVCDGIKSYTNEICFVAGGSYDTRTELIPDAQYYHMRWGYGGNYDGWFRSGSYHVGNNSFNYDVKIISDIGI